MLASGLDLASDVLKVGHHGSSTSTNPTFIAAVKSSVAVIHVGRNNPYGHPSPLVLKCLPKQLYRTDLDKTVIISVDSEGALQIETAREVANVHYREVTLIGDRQNKRFHTFDCPPYRVQLIRWGSLTTIMHRARL